MNNIKAMLYAIINVVLGFITPFLSVLGFRLATNSLKGWDVYDPDGAMFIPVGIIMLLIVVAIIIKQISMIIRDKKSQKKDKYINNIAYIIGIVCFVLWVV